MEDTVVFFVPSKYLPGSNFLNSGPLNRVAFMRFNALALELCIVFLLLFQALEDDEMLRPATAAAAVWGRFVSRLDAAAPPLPPTAVVPPRKTLSASDMVRFLTKSTKYPQLST